MKTIIKKGISLLLFVFLMLIMTVSVSAAKIPARLIVEGYKEREIVSYQYEINTNTDENGQQVGLPNGEFLVIEVKALPDGNNELVSWMLKRNLTKNGKIELVDTKTGKVTKTISFKNAYCVDYHEKTTEDGIHTEVISLSYQKLQNGDAALEKDWANKLPEDEKEDVVASVFSGGALWIIIGVAAVAALAAVVILVVKKKKKPAVADTTADEDTEE